MNTAIIVAAGSGTRFGSNTPKILHQLRGKPVLSYSIDAFEAAASIDEIVIVVASEQFQESWRTTLHPPIKPRNWTIGGTTRAESARNGFHVMQAETEIVVVHDAARPLIRSSEIDAVVALAVETGAACLAAPVTDTIKEISGDRITRTIDRTLLRRALTPQAFRRTILDEAFSEKNFDAAATDECYLVETLGYPVAFIEGDLSNIKITHPEDIKMAEMLLNALEHHA